MNVQPRTPFPVEPSSPRFTLTFPNQQQLKYYKPVATIYAAFIHALFQAEPNSGLNFFQPHTFISLPFFIAYALSKSPIDAPMVALATLSLLYRYKSRIAQCQTKLRDPSRLFISAYLVAAKLLSDKSYPMRTWASLGQNNYSTREMTVMEREFCLALDWNLSLNPEVLNSLRIIIEVYLSMAGLPRLVNSRVYRTPCESNLSINTPDLARSPRSEFSLTLSTSTSTSETNEDWEWIQEIGESRSMVEDLNSRFFELEEEFDSSLSPQTEGVIQEHRTKVSMKRRISNLFQAKFGNRATHGITA